MKTPLLVVLALIAIASACPAQPYGYGRDARSVRYEPYRFSRNEGFWYGYGTFDPPPPVPARAYYPYPGLAPEALGFVRSYQEQVYRAIADEIYREQFATDVRRRVEEIRPVPVTGRGDEPAQIRIPEFSPPPTTRPSIYERDNGREMPSQPTGLRQLRGTLVSTSAIRYANESEPHVIAWVRSGPSATGVADLGGRSQLRLLPLARGGPMQVIGHPGRINGQPALFAQVIQTPTQTVNLSNARSAPTTRPSDRGPTTGPSASSGVSAQPAIRYTEQGVAGRP